MIGTFCFFHEDEFIHSVLGLLKPCLELAVTGWDDVAFIYFFFILSLQRPAAPLEMAPPNDEPASAPMPRDSAVELLSTLGKSYEQGQLTEDDLQEFIKNVDLEFDDPRLLEDFERKNSEENAEDSIWKVTKAQADEPIGSPYHPRGQQQRLSAGAGILKGTNPQNKNQQYFY